MNFLQDKILHNSLLLAPVKVGATKRQICITKCKKGEGRWRDEKILTRLAKVNEPYMARRAPDDSILGVIINNYSSGSVNIHR